MSRDNQNDYDEETTQLCERTLVTLLGDVGPWRDRIYLVGGLAPRYIVGRLPEGARAHIGTTDVDLVIGLALGDDTPETYRTLETNLRNAGFTPENSFRWTRKAEGRRVQVEFLCETDQVGPGKIFKPKDEHTGSGLGAFNVPGAQLVTRDHHEHEIEADRLDEGGRSRISVRVANLLAYTVLKILAFQDRHDNKDAYDLVFCILNSPGSGPYAAGRQAANSPIAGDPKVAEALQLLAERFDREDNDGPAAYANFLGEPGMAEELARLRRDAVAAVRQFITGFRERRPPS